MKIKSLVLTCMAASLLTFNVMAAENATTEKVTPEKVTTEKTTTVTQPADATVINKEADQMVKKQEFIEKININKANAAELAAGLNGIGESKAQAIVQFREQNGPFKSVEELSQVKGIGEATLAKNKNRIIIE